MPARSVHITHGVNRFERSKLGKILGMTAAKIVLINTLFERIDLNTLRHLIANVPLNRLHTTHETMINQFFKNVHDPKIRISSL